MAVDKNPLRVAENAVFDHSTMALAFLTGVSRFR